jgi:hypothetical protein
VPVFEQQQSRRHAGDCGEQRRERFTHGRLQRFAAQVLRKWIGVARHGKKMQIQRREGLERR